MSGTKDEADLRACVVVLGDLGRSPRMQYHAQSLATEGFRVDLVGYSGSELFPSVAGNERIRPVHVPQPPAFIQRLPRIAALILKAVWQLATLLIWLPWMSVPHVTLVQNPPGLPAIAACRFFCLVLRGRLVVDWHNYGFSVLGQGQPPGKESVAVRVMRWYEGAFGRTAHAHLCVTKAMRENLHARWGINAQVLYDRPPSHFKPLEDNERNAVQAHLADLIPGLLNKPTPGLLVSGTSWTEDEDFGVLLEALQHYEEAKDTNPSLPPLLCVITGKGPLKEHYCRLVDDQGWKHIKVETPWLPPEDYPKLLALADLGVSLHTSTSGLDLPMKVVDMFGCGLPVCALEFPALPELVRHDCNGLVFKDSDQLADQIILWFKEPNMHQKFRNNLQDFRLLGWHQCWINALPIFKL